MSCPKHPNVKGVCCLCSNPQPWEPSEPQPVTFVEAKPDPVRPWVLTEGDLALLREHHEQTQKWL